MEQTLGSVTHYLNLRRADSLSNGASRRWIPIPYRAGALPWTLSGSWVARQALRPLLDDLDGIFIHTMTLAPGSVNLFRQKPLIISCDGTPIAKRGMRAAYGLHPEVDWMSEAKRELFRWVFKRAVGFVAWSAWAKQSLIADYGCREEDVAVIPPGVDIHAFAPGERDHALPRILFVGRDFVRKGGDLLLDVFRRQLRGRSELVLVTGDDIPEEPGVTVHRSIAANSEQMRQLYATSDIFALPTRADCYSLVCMEALAAGLPIVTTRIGGVPDLVREGETGHLIDSDDVQALERTLVALIMEPARRSAMSRAARADAERRYDVRENAEALFSFVGSRC
jgi:glycosyltransferase involved in cell wall biosynthesis